MIGVVFYACIVMGGAVGARVWEVSTANNFSMTNNFVATFRHLERLDQCSAEGVDKHE